MAQETKDAIEEIRRLELRVRELEEANEALRRKGTGGPHADDSPSPNGQSVAIGEGSLRLIIDMIPALAWSAAIDGSAEFFNQHYLDFVGRPAEEMQGVGWASSVHPDDIGGLLAVWMQMMESQQGGEAEARLRRHDGEYRWFMFRTNPLRDESGTLVKWYGVNSDIEDRKRSEDTLRQSEQSLRSVIDGIPGFVAILSADGGVEMVNQQIIDFCGVPIEDLRNWGTNGIVHPEDMPHVAEIFGRSIATGAPYNIEQRIRRSDGEYLWMSNRGLPVIDEAGRVVRWYVLLADIDVMKRADEALAASERHARLIVDSMPGLVAVFLRSGELESVNHQVEEFYGKSLEELKRWPELLVHPDDRSRVWDNFARSMASGEPFKIENRSRRFDGAYRWLESRGQPLRDADGAIVRWYNLLVDVDERKRAEDTVRDTEQQLRLIVNTIPGFVAVFGASGNVEELNEQFLAYLGQSVEEFAAWPTNGTVHPDDLKRHVEILDRSLASGDPIDFETRLRRHDGAYRWFQLRGHPARDTDGRIVRWYCLMTDIDDRRRAEEAVASSGRDLKLVIDTIPTLAWSAGTDGACDFFSQHFLDYTGLSAEAALGWGWTVAVHPDDMAGLAAAWQRIMTSGRTGDAEARLRRHDGEYRWFLFRANPLRGETGAIVKWYGVNTDIEELKRAEASIAREKQLLEMIASGHPLREVLTELCRFVERDAVDILCDVHPIDWSNRTFRYGTSPSLPETYTAPITGLPVKDELLPCAVAANEKVQIIAEDLETDPRWLSSPVRTHALEYGLRAVWSTPIFATNGTVLGTFCIYRRKPATPSAEHQSLIAHATHIASIAIERLQTEEELRRSYERLAAAQKLSKTGNFTADVVVDNHIWSAELYRIFEFDPGMKISVQHVRDVIHPDDLSAFDTDFQRSAAEGTPFDQVFRIITKGGKLKHLHALAEVAEMAENRPVFSGAIRDVTDERVAEEALSTTRSELAHVARITALSALTASIAHEVNQPLSGIITNANTCLRMLAADPPNVEGARETARRTIRDGKRASDVISGLRSLFSRKSIVAEAVDLNQATEEVVALCSNELQRHRISLQTKLGDDVPPTTGDRVQLQQVILNLILNATDSLKTVHDRPRQIFLETAEGEDGSAVLTVRDTGEGVSPDARSRLFEAFYTTKADGMGIGLSVSRSIIDRHQGRLWLLDTDGPGAAFSFSIPRGSVGGIVHKPGEPDGARGGVA